MPAWTTFARTASSGSTGPTCSGSATDGASQTCGTRSSAAASPGCRCRATGRSPGPRARSSQPRSPRARFQAPAGSEPGEFISYTTGTTGKPKGVVCTRGMVEASLSAWSSLELREAGDRNLSFGPIFSLLDMCLGVTAVLPRLDPRRPLAFDPLQLVKIMRDQRVTRSFASPRIAEKLTRACLDTGQTLPALRVLMVGGAIVEESVLQGANREFLTGEAYVCYGATGAVPIFLTPASEVLGDPPSTSERGERGFLVGRPLGLIRAEIARLTTRRGEDSLGGAAARRGGELLPTGANVSRGTWGRGDSRRAQDRGRPRLLAQGRATLPIGTRPATYIFADGAGDRIEQGGQIFDAARWSGVFNPPEGIPDGADPRPGGALGIVIEPVRGASPATRSRARHSSESFGSSPPRTLCCTA